MKKAIIFFIFFLTIESVMAETNQLLFIIERNKNANVVQYDALISDDGSLVADKPIRAYWVMKELDGRHEDLTWLERKLAYGFKVKQDRSRRFFLLQLVSFRDREIKVYKDGNMVRAETIIDGRASFIDRIYVDSYGEGPLIKVNYVDIHGRDKINGERRFERVFIKKKEL